MSHIIYGSDFKEIVAVSDRLAILCRGNAVFLGLIQEDKAVWQLHIFLSPPTLTVGGTNEISKMILFVR